MDERAFQIPRPPADEVTIDDKALLHITDIAQDIFRDSKGKVDSKKLLFQALSDYMVRHGARPNFKVVL